MTSTNVIPNYMSNFRGQFTQYPNERLLRVVMLIQSYHPCQSGESQQLLATAPLLKAQGIDLHIVTLRQPGLNRFEIVHGIPVHRLSIPMNSPLRSMSFSLGAMPLLRQLQPDLVHSHALLSPTTTAVMAKRLNGTPVVAKVVKSGILGDISKLKRKPFGMRRIATYCAHVDAFIAMSQEINRELREMGVPTNKRVFIPNGVHTKRFKPVGPLKKRQLRQELGLPSGPIVVFTGRLTMGKRLDQLIYVWQDIRKEFDTAHLLIVGGGEQEARLRTIADDGVIFTGHVDRVDSYLNASDIFVHPAATGGLSNSLLEAMAAGLPVIATNIGGAPDLIEQGQIGHLIQPDHPDQLYYALRLMLLNDHQLRMMGEKSRERILQDYALSAVAYRLRSLYDDVVSRKQSMIWETI